jgi:hypothetical protein
MQGQHLYILRYLVSIFNNLESILIVTLGLLGYSNGYQTTVAMIHNTILFVRCVGRYLPTLSFGLVVVVYLLFGAIPSIRNVMAQKLVKDYCCNLEQEL